NQVMGDGIMALFGAPLAHEDHAMRACYAALRMHGTVGRYAEELRRTQGLNLQIRAGVNSGEVVVRSIGNDLHMDYTAVGQTTHLASRMEQLASPGTTLITGETLRLAEGYFKVKPLGPVPVKGLTEPIEVYEVTGAGPVRTRLQAAAARGLTRFVGRDAEVEALRQALEKARGGHGQVVAIVGEPGVGKSRLFYEFIHSHRTHGWLVLESGSVSYGKATPYLPVIDLLKAYFKIQDRDDQREIREKVTGKLLTLDEALKPSLPGFLNLLDLPVEDSQWQGLDPPQRRQRTLEAVKRLLLRESQLQPLVLVFEDLHWIDSESQAALDSLIESLPTARILLLVNYRPEYEHRWSGKSYYRQLRLDPLPPESAEGLLTGLLGEDPSLRALKPLLFERTEGNPFFLEESVRSLVETKFLAGERGAYRLTKALEGLQIPATARAILASRIDRLSPDEKRLLQAASVIGKDLPFALLQAIAEESEDGLRQKLGRLQTAEFLYEARLFPDLEYTFRHALTLEVTYTTLLHDRRRSLHAGIVEAIERLSPDRLAEEVERLAHHALEGEVWPKALRYLRQAGRKANARCAFREAASHFERALLSLQHLPEDPDGTARAIDLRFDLRNALIPLGDLEPLLDHLREAERLAQGIGDRRRLGRAASLLSNFFQLTGDHALAMESGRRAEAIAAELGDRSLEAAANLYLGQTCCAMGNYRQAVEILTRNEVALAGESGGERLSEAAFRFITSRTWSVWSLAELGRFTDGLARGQEAVRLAENADHAGALLSAYQGLGFLYVSRGEADQAAAVLGRGVELCQAAGIPAMFPLMASSLGAAHLLAGRVDEGLALLEEAVAQGAARRMMGCQSLRVAQLGEGLLLAGRLDDASAASDQALELARAHEERGHEAWALRLAAELHSHPDRLKVEQARDLWREAMALAGALGMRPLVARCHLGLGTLCLRTGERQAAREHLTTAATGFREMAMRLWSERAAAALRELG
ncbi:MAG TPA: hypothetical protein DCQ64_06925, partial [Candidatus Rokubacteria bacterium]|nr:hypothetical protein [Candidatus Rokubacteria bacterium]